MRSHRISKRVLLSLVYIEMVWVELPSTYDGTNFLLEGLGGTSDDYQDSNDSIRTVFNGPLMRRQQKGRVAPALPPHPGSSEERSSRQQSETEVVFLLTSFTGHCPIPPEGGTSHHRSGEQYPSVFEELSKKIPAEDESDALNLDGEVTQYGDQEADFETDVEDNPFHVEYSDTNYLHTFNL
ncbi:hypothetical protein AVEN_71676-1 [Araneus ventricosus]|uniref:Uncharacterized protein n=1 Tax=Araneus ventricosus TaxID=182803 RepID=A0A4Y2FC61_ARAVE|nr:hypothetical protein AVEN_71676-1 [Araneus ventricosus]